MTTGPAAPARGWGGPGEATTLLLVRHGVTALTAEKRFSGGLGGSDPGLSEEGRAQARATADWLAPLVAGIDGGLAGVVTSPVRRTRETAEVLAETWGTGAPTTEPGVAEMDFGAWDGLSFAEIRERYADDVTAWLGSTEVAAGGTGESFRTVESRVLAGLERVVAAHRGRTVAVVSHVSPIKILVAHALDAPLEAVYRMELTPASATVISWYADADGGPDRPSLRIFNASPPGVGLPLR